MNPILYDGYVNVKIKNKKFYIHNNGTNYLFKMFANILTGHSFDNNNVPKYFQVVINNYDLTNESPLTLGQLGLFNNVHISSQIEKKKSPYTGKEQWTAVFTGTLTSENFRDDLQTDTNYYLTLMNGYGYAIAYIQLNTELITHLKAGNQALIQWNVCFGNSNDILSGSTSTEE